MSGTHAVVVGFGSIGARHTRVLESLGCAVTVVSRRPNVHQRQCSHLSEALSPAVAYVVVADETSRHAATLRGIREAGYAGRVLVEKPLVSTRSDLDQLRPADRENVWVAYQLRFDPLMHVVRDLIAGSPVLSAEVRACSYLPDWRPGRDYRLTESASAAAGGGVLRDMSHELDYVQWLFGAWRRVSALGGRISTLEIDTDDSAAVLLQTDRCPVVAISLNYLDRVEERWVVVNTPDATIRADIFGRTVHVNGELVFQGSTADVDETYVSETRAMLAGSVEHACSLEAGAMTVDLIGAIETAQREARWVTR